MNSQQSCAHGHTAPDAVIQALPISQGGTGRHKCVICAYAAGVADAQAGVMPSGNLEKCSHQSSAPTTMLASLAVDQGGAGRHKCTNCAYEQGFSSGANTAKAFQIAQDSIDTEEAARGSIDDFTPRTEGQMKVRTSITYERSAVNRGKAIELHGTLCAACGFDFDAFYGEAFARHFIEIHHVESVTTLAGRVVDPAQDLVPLCSNCHSMAHRQKGVITTVAELKALIKAAQTAKESKN